jgi:hypothetical protein
VILLVCIAIITGASGLFWSALALKSSGVYDPWEVACGASVLFIISVAAIVAAFEHIR